MASSAAAAGDEGQSEREGGREGEKEGWRESKGRPDGGIEGGDVEWVEKLAAHVHIFITGPYLNFLHFLLTPFFLLFLHFLSCLLSSLSSSLMLPPPTPDPVSGVHGPEEDLCVPVQPQHLQAVL